MFYKFEFSQKYVRKRSKLLNHSKKGIRCFKQTFNGFMKRLKNSNFQKSTLKNEVLTFSLSKYFKKFAFSKTSDEIQIQAF